MKVDWGFEVSARKNNAYYVLGGYDDGLPLLTKTVQKFLPLMQWCPPLPSSPAFFLCILIAFLILGWRILGDPSETPCCCNHWPNDPHITLTTAQSVIPLWIYLVQWQKNELATQCGEHNTITQRSGAMAWWQIHRSEVSLLSACRQNVLVKSHLVKLRRKHFHSVNLSHHYHHWTWAWGLASLI